MDIQTSPLKMLLSNQSPEYRQPTKSNSFQYRLIRSRRRSFAMQVEAGGTLVIRAPLHYSDHDIQRMMDKYETWIKIHVHAASQHQPYRFIEGEKYLYLGVQYPLVFGNSGGGTIKFDNALIVAEELRAKAGMLILQWFKNEAAKYLSARIKELSKQYNFSFSRLRISNAKANWGSCSTKGTISLNWRLVQCPPKVIDYIIIHELAHLREMNHSPHFWALVETMCPDCQNHKKWLRRNSPMLRTF